jgi:hypothetical protein
MPGSTRLAMWFTVPALALCPATTPAQTPEADSSLVPAWVLPRATLRLTLRSPLPPQASRAPERFKGTLLRSTPDSLWVDRLDGEGPPRGFGEVDLNRIDLVSGTHGHAGIGALLGLGGGVTLGFLGTAVIGSAETDNVLPAWGLLVGPFLGAVVGRLVRSDDLVPVWIRPGSPDSNVDSEARGGSRETPEKEDRR